MLGRAPAVGSKSRYQVFGGDCLAADRAGQAPPLRGDVKSPLQFSAVSSSVRTSSDRRPRRFCLAGPPTSQSAD